MKKLLIIVLIGSLFAGCSNSKSEDQKKSNAPIIGDEKQTGKW
ncbi:MAG: hypothetical protein PHR75_03350 [Sulfurovum sp.]|nr:hypothetical protein [Sulfurovum sp.]MDD3602487.1 hypothetical protein [Sulfurovum sp.]